MFLNLQSQPTKYWVIGHSATELTGLAFDDRLFVFESHAKMAIEEICYGIGDEFKHLKLRPMLVEVTARPCEESESRAYSAEQKEWLKKHGSGAQRAAQAQHDEMTQTQLDI